ncbi:hypothetical protein QFC21_005401 [Naganishia friedmannii]|uniref:Uncharacterized protein n=1 Tax=Naganishia friedmannii TaxID=89922 RepID=A0ACC2VAD2_9TREE|nr:hypothetical protein QFC21_005401 [Naganishia friedmannii]
MVGMFSQGLPFDLDIACPINIPWQAAAEPEISASGSLTDEAEEQDEGYDYLSRRYWETLYLPESLAPVEGLCAHLLRIRRDLPLETSDNLGSVDGRQSKLELSDIKLFKDQSLRDTVEGDYNGAKTLEDQEQAEQYIGNARLPLDKSITKKKRKRDPANRSIEEIRSPLHRLLLTIPQLERKHRQGVAVVLSRAMSRYCGLPYPSTSDVSLQRNADDSAAALPSADNKASHYFSRLEMSILENAIKIRNTSGKAEDDMVALHRNIDAEVEQWYQESRSAKSHRELQAGSADGIVLESPRHSGQAARGAGAQVSAQFLDVRAKKEELLTSVMSARIKSLKGQLERREVLLQVILLLVINHLYGTATPLDQETGDASEEEDDVQLEDPESEYRQRKLKKKEKKSRTTLASIIHETSADVPRVARWKRRRSISMAVEDEDRPPPNPAVMLDLFADRVTLWQAIGVGIHGDDGLKSNHGASKTGDSLDCEVASDTDDQYGSSRPSLAGSGTRRAALPSARSMEEWDWIQKFCVCIIERYFLVINRKFCESFHLKVFGEALASTEPDGEQDQLIDNYDVASVHTVNTDTSAGGRERSFSPAASVTSVTSRANSLLESSHSLEPSSGLNGDQHGQFSVEPPFNRKPGVNSTNTRDSLPRAKSNANSSQLFKNRQVGFTRTNSSYLSATANGSVSIVMGKRKTMVVPIPVNKLPRAERKVSGGNAMFSPSKRVVHTTTARKPAAMGNRRSVSGGEDSRYQTESQASGSATLALATPSKPRANQIMARGATGHTYVRVTSRQRPGANVQAHDVSNDRNFGSSISDHSAGFVAEIPALTSSRRRTMDQQVLGRTTSLSITSRVSSDHVLLGHRLTSERYMSVKAPFGMENTETDDLADFMVDTDDEDEPSLGNGMVSNRGLNKTLLRSRGMHADQDVHEVPETPLKAR